MYDNCFINFWVDYFDEIIVFLSVMKFNKYSLYTVSDICRTETYWDLKIIVKI